MDALVGAIKELTEQQIEFICSEANVKKERLLAMTEEELDDIYDVMCDIEIATIPATDDEEEPERCKMASDIVTALGNAIAESEGRFDNDDEIEDGEDGANDGISMLRDFILSKQNNE